MERKKITFDSFIRGVILGVIIIGILMLLKRLSSVLLPFFIAWLIAYLVYPLVTFYQYKLKLRNRIVSIFCALLTLLIVGAGAFYLLVPPMIQECGRVQTLLVQYFSHGTYNSNVPTSLSDFLRDNIDVKFITELFNKENLLDALKASDCDMIKMEINGALSPMRVMPLEGESFLFLVLPVRVKNDD